MTTTMIWSPEEVPLRELVRFLNDSLSGYDHNVQKKAELVSYNLVGGIVGQELTKHSPL